jgi:Na+-transporting NADH:ubiquinone oxidoreductase subunit NqrD
MGSSILILASGRLAFALTAAGSLLWVYTLSALIHGVVRPALPEKGKRWILVLLASMVGSVYILLLWFLSPLLVLETFFVLFLVPICCMASDILERTGSLNPADIMTEAYSEAATLSVLTVCLSLIREPLGFCTLSLPGGSEGIFFLFVAEEEAFFPIRIIAATPGALFLLGYGIVLFRRIEVFRQEEGR